MNRQGGRSARIRRWRDSAPKNSRASEIFGGSKQGDNYGRKLFASDKDPNRYSRGVQETWTIKIGGNVYIS